MMDKKIAPSLDIREFFYKKIKEAIMLNNIKVSDEVEVYLVHVLYFFSKSENLFQEDESGKIEYRPLALKLYDAVFSEPKERIKHLKSLGDTALYHAGVFYEGLSCSVVDIDYYIGMGGTAYSSLANMTPLINKNMANVYHEMSHQFSGLVELINICCEKETKPTDTDLLKLLDKYHKTGSKRAEKILKEQGILPDDLLNTNSLQ